MQTTIIFNGNSARSFNSLHLFKSASFSKRQIFVEIKSFRFAAEFFDDAAVIRVIRLEHERGSSVQISLRDADQRACSAGSDEQFGLFRFYVNGDVVVRFDLFRDRFPNG